MVLEFIFNRCTRNYSEKMFYMSPVIKQARKVNKSPNQSWLRNFISSAFLLKRGNQSLFISYILDILLKISFMMNLSWSKNSLMLRCMVQLSPHFCCFSSITKVDQFKVNPGRMSWVLSNINALIWPPWDWASHCSWCKEVGRNNQFWVGWRGKRQDCSFPGQQH